jgi:ATP/maltotriose-dependent transcriptional regulator MalT
MFAMRTGSLEGIGELMESSAHLVPRLTEPHLVSAFYYCRGSLAAVQGRYKDALESATKCERYALDVRLPFVVPHAWRVSAMAELGLRHFARCSRVLDRLDRRVVETKDILHQIESKLVRARLLIAQNLASEAIAILAASPKRFPFAGEQGEYLATFGLAHACVGDPREALRLARQARHYGQTVEVRSLTACIEAIAALRVGSSDGERLTYAAVGTVLEAGGIDSFVTAYRGYPALLNVAGTASEYTDVLTSIVDQARDFALAKACRLPNSRSDRHAGTISPREKEVLDLLAYGLKNKEIARALFISEATVKVHVRHILEKLGVKTRTQAAVRAAELSEED